MKKGSARVGKKQFIPVFVCCRINDLKIHQSFHMFIISMHILQLQLS
jgi:hypothetical protein